MRNRPIALIDMDGVLADFDAPYNRDIATDLRLKGWSDPNLANILNLCLERSKTRL